MNCVDKSYSKYDRGMLLLERLIFRRLRRRVFPGLRGDVLELGVGTGVNLPLYGAGARVTGCDASEGSLGWAARRRTRSPVTLVQADAQRLPFADGSFDVVTASLVFCSIADPARGLAEARRVLRRPEHRGELVEGTRPEPVEGTRPELRGELVEPPVEGTRPEPVEGRAGGRLVLLEHTRGSGLGAWLTDAVGLLWNTWSSECRLNRETTQAVAEAGFRLDRVERYALGIVRVIKASV
jgi:SAM-dependent methyltransferase